MSGELLAFQAFVSEAEGWACGVGELAVMLFLGVAGVGIFSGMLYMVGCAVFILIDGIRAAWKTIEGWDW